MVSPLTWWTYLVEWAQGRLDDHPENCDCRACYYSSLDRKAKPSTSYKSYQQTYYDNTLSEEAVQYWVSWFITRFPEIHTHHTALAGAEYLSNALKLAGRDGVGLVMMTYVDEAKECLTDAQWQILVSSRAQTANASGDFIATLDAVAEVGPVQLVHNLDNGCLADE